MKIKDLFLRKLAEEPEANTPASTEAESDASNTADGEPSVSAESSTEDDLWGEMLDNSDDDESTGESETTAVEADDETDETPPAEPKAEEPPAEEPKAEEPPAEPSPQAEPAQQQEPLNQEQVKAEAERLRGQALSELTNLYKLTDEEAENLQVSPETELPRLAAQLHMNMIEALHFGLQQQLPYMIEQVTAVKSEQQKAVNTFYEVWPQLKNEAYNDTVLRTMQVYKQLNPGAPLEKVIQEGGAMAMAALKIPYQESAPAPQQQQRQQAPPAPLAPGNSTVPQNKGPVNEFEAIFEEAVNEGF